MIGILCNLKMKNKYSAYFHSLMKYSRKGENIPVIVFGVSDINLSNNTARGTMVSADKVETATVEIPQIIYNFASIRKRRNKKILRSLTELEGINLLNEANSFKQWAVMDMLRTFEHAGRYLLPCYAYSRRETDLSFSQGENWLFVPHKGLKKSIVYIKSVKSNFMIYCNKKIFKIASSDIYRTLDSIMTKNRWTALCSPRLLTCDGMPHITRVYLQKVDSHLWTVLGQRDVNRVMRPSLKILTREALELIKCIDCFIPGLGICYIDFVLDQEERPYFLALGGWDKYVLNVDRNDKIHRILWKNLLINFKLRTGMLRGGMEHVGKN